MVHIIIPKNNSAGKLFIESFFFVNKIDRTILISTLIFAQDYSDTIIDTLVLTDHLNILAYIKAWFLPNNKIKLLFL